MVKDVRKSVEFYRDILDMNPLFHVDDNRQSHFDGDPSDGDLTFAVMQWNGFQLMLQEQLSLRAYIQHEAFERDPILTGTVYFRDKPIKDVMTNCPEENIVKKPFIQWYGMREVYIRDPDGYMLCVSEKVDGFEM